MKRNSLLGILLVFTLFSCDKSSRIMVDDSIVGKWKMIRVKDLATNSLLTKPANIQGDVIVTFVATSGTTGRYSGKTPSNTFSSSPASAQGYILKSYSAISISPFSITNAAETGWGREFTDNITNASQYNISNARMLEIETPDKVFSFEKQ